MSRGSSNSRRAVAISVAASVVAYGRVAERVHELGVQVRAGLHTGEIEIVEGGIAGIAVHIAARVAGLAGPDEVFVSSTVKDLVAGSGLTFAEHGTFELKGVPGTWRIFRVESPGS